MVRRIILIFFLIGFIACDEESDIVNEPIVNKIDSTFQLNLELGIIHELENGTGEEMEIKLRQFKTELWANSFWDTINKSEKETWVIQQKIFEGTFPHTAYFGITENDSLYIFGAKKHLLINKEITLDHYVPVFELPKKPISGTFVEEKLLSYNNIEYFSKDSTIINVNRIDSIIDIEIRTFAIRRGFREGIWEQQFILENGKGFRRFWEYNLTDYSNP